MSRRRPERLQQTAVLGEAARHDDDSPIRETDDTASVEETIPSDPVVPSPDAAAQGEIGSADDLDTPDLHG